MSVKIVTSLALDAEGCAREIAQGLSGFDAKFAVFFATPRVDPERLGAALASRLGTVPSIGCTTAGELSEGHMRKGAVVMMAMDADTVEGARVGSLSSVAEPGAVLGTLESLSGPGLTPAGLDPERNVGLVLHDGLQAAEEAVMARLGELTNVPFVGGSAGDELAFERTVVFENFQPKTKTSVLALLRPKRPYRILKTQSFRVLDPVFEVTEACAKTRTVKRFNGQPAAQAYAEALGVPLAEAHQYFRKHPVGMVLGDGQPFVRSFQQIVGEAEMKCYCQINEGARVHLLESENLVEVTARDLKQAVSAMPSVSGIIDFDCVQRRLELESLDQIRAYGELFADLPAIGFSTYGESYIGHINQTATMLLLG